MLDYFDDIYSGDACVCEYYNEARSNEEVVYWQEISDYSLLETKYAVLYHYPKTINLIFELKRLFDVHYFLWQYIVVAEIAETIAFSGEELLINLYPPIPPSSSFDASSSRAPVKPPERYSKNSSLKKKAVTLALSIKKDHEKKSKARTVIRTHYCTGSRTNKVLHYNEDILQDSFLLRKLLAR